MRGGIGLVIVMLVMAMMALQYVVLGFFLYLEIGPALICLAMLVAWFFWFKGLPEEADIGDFGFIIPVVIILIAGFA